MLDIIFHFFLFFFLITTNGLIFFQICISKNLDLNFFELTILGLIATGFLSLLLNYFIPLNNTAILLNTILNMTILFFYRNGINLNFNKNTKSILIMIGMFVLCSVQIYGSGFSDDLTHYHGGQIINSDNLKYIVGMNFLHHHYGYGSIWLALHSYLNFNGSYLQDIHVLNALLLFVILSYFLTELINTKKEKNTYAQLAITVFIFFFLTKYTRLKEFGLDRPGILLFCFLIYFFLKFKNTKHAYGYSFICITIIICLFLTAIKLLFIFSFIIPLFVIFDTKNYYFFRCREFLFSTFLGLAYVGKNILWTGCLIYPIYFTCFESISWNSKKIASNALFNLEYHTKGYDSYVGTLLKGQYLLNFNWVPTWYQIVSEQLIAYTLLSALIIAVVLLVSEKTNTDSYGSHSKFVILSLLVMNLFLFLKTPVIRYHHSLFLLFILSFFIFQKRIIVKRKIIFGIIVVLFFFNVGKNIDRIFKSNFINNPIEHLKMIDWYQKPTKYKKGNFIYYGGWMGAYPIGNENLDNKKYKKKFFDIIYN